MKKIIVVLILLASLTGFSQATLKPNISPDVAHLTQEIKGDALCLKTEFGIRKVEFINRRNTNVFEFYTDGAKEVQIQNISTFPEGIYVVAVSSNDSLILFNIAVSKNNSLTVFIPYDNTHAKKFYPTYSRDTLYVKETREQYLQRVK
ncbi:hypothetical protein ACFFVB_18370 [Formosa undariae]|uniref:T9SS type A sorting domain-containing protein n=1 Tax=Formosa undariae TaxID=1325436 RepID=A0ABV5F6H4_9FLAO